MSAAGAFNVDIEVAAPSLSDKTETIKVYCRSLTDKWEVQVESKDLEEFHHTLISDTTITDNKKIDLPQECPQISDALSCQLFLSRIACIGHILRMEKFWTFLNIPRSVCDGLSYASSKPFGDTLYESKMLRHTIDAVTEDREWFFRLVKDNRGGSLVWYKDETKKFVISSLKIGASTNVKLEWKNNDNVFVFDIKSGKRVWQIQTTESGNWKKWRDSFNQLLRQFGSSVTEEKKEEESDRSNVVVNISDDEKVTIANENDIKQLQMSIDHDVKPQLTHQLCPIDEQPLKQKVECYGKCSFCLQTEEKESNGLWLCDNCDYALCSLCYHKDKLPPSCPKTRYHLNAIELKEKNDVEQKWKCDGCYKTYMKDRKITAWKCQFRYCGYCICHICYETADNPLFLTCFCDEKLILREPNRNKKEETDWRSLKSFDIDDTENVLDEEYESTVEHEEEEPLQTKDNEKYIPLTKIPTNADEEEKMNIVAGSDTKSRTINKRAGGGKFLDKIKSTARDKKSKQKKKKINKNTIVETHFNKKYAEKCYSCKCNIFEVPHYSCNEPHRYVLNGSFHIQLCKLCMHQMVKWKDDEDEKEIGETPMVSAKNPYMIAAKLFKRKHKETKTIYQGHVLENLKDIKAVWESIGDDEDRTCFIEVVINHLGIEEKLETGTAESDVKMIVKLYWLFSKQDYEKYFKYTYGVVDQVNIPEISGNDTNRWEPGFFPEIKFLHTMEKVEPTKIKVIVQNIRDLFGEIYLSSMEQNEKPSKSVAPVYRGWGLVGCVEYYCDVKILEPFELKSFPFDCQDIPIFIAPDNFQRIAPAYLHKEKPFIRIAGEATNLGIWSASSTMVEFNNCL
eukprot:515914_1